MWGQVADEDFACFAKRIIPTRVGTSCCVRVGYTKLWDHPHACGDKRHLRAFPPASVGSSPRVWGQAGIILLFSLLSRIIPTRVGTSTFVPLLSISVEDHPHACGDKKNILTRRLMPPGSSPRVWGQVYVNAVKLIPYRIIPTRVGTR